ncbi:MAG TPA: LacI family DNA-binding transcriptional regulator [Verrucomicrobiae bacterium]
MRQELPKPRVTLRDIAKSLNVSHTTVSRALRNDAELARATREKINRTALKMGYKPDPMLKALAHYRRSKINLPIAAELAWFNHWPNPDKLRTYKEFNFYWEGAFAEAERSGFRLEEFRLKDARLERLQGILRARGIRGILLPPHGDFAPDYHQFDWEDFCIVRFGYSISYPPAHVVSSDQLTDGIIAYENMFKQGYRRIGLVTSYKMLTRFSAGYMFSQMRCNPSVNVPVLTFYEEQPRENKVLLKRWLKTHKPDAILTDVAELRKLLSEIGRKVPGDVGLAALSVLDGNADAGINQNSYEIGRIAVQLLISLINHNELGVPKICREVLVKGSWVDGSTLTARD